MTTRLYPDSPLVGHFVASPNHGERRGHGRPNCLILHYTGMPTGEAALRALTDPASEVSAHYLVWEDGLIDQLVAESDRAWHAGKGSWKGESDLNSTSIGIEIVNPGHDGGSPPFPDRQIEATIALARDICARWAIAPERVLAHSDVAPARKRDPGEAFPWEALWRNGVGHWTEPAPLTGSPAVRSRGGRPAGAGDAGDAGALRLWGGDHGDLRPPDPAGGRRLPAPLPTGARRRPSGRFDNRDAEGADRRAAAKYWVTDQKALGITAETHIFAHSRGHEPGDWTWISTVGSVGLVSADTPRISAPTRSTASS